MALTDAQWAAVQIDVNVRLNAGAITEAQAVAELTAATEDWPTRTLSNADLALRVSRVLANLGGLIETEGPPSMDVGAPGATAFDSFNIAFYGPKTAESWGEPRSLIGVPGPAIELQTTATHVQWRVDGAPGWTNLIALADLAGADGEEVSLRATATHVQWRVGAGAWSDLIALADLMGADGREVELQTSATHIQWRYAGDAGWTDLVALSAITPEPVPGPAAWTPVIASVADGERRVWRIADWVGGGGAKPATGQYLGPTGLVETAAEATDVRGAGGSGSGDMIAANNLSDLTDKAAARTTLSVYSRTEADALLDDKQDALGFTPADAAAVAAALEDKADLVGGKVPAAQLPDPPAVPTKTTGAKVRAGTNDDEFVTPKSVSDAAAYVTTPWAASLGLDLSIPAQIVVLGGHTTLTAPTNAKPGVSARVLLKQPASGGPFTVSYNAAFLFFGPTPAASTAANAVDLLILDPETTTKVSAVLQKGRSA